LREKLVLIFEMKLAKLIKLSATLANIFMAWHAAQVYMSHKQRV
jgi:hypothetical protein